MNFKASYMKKVFILLLAFQLAGFACPVLIPKAHALFWEDSGDENNDPKETKTRPDHFSLFDWVGDIANDAKKDEYRDKDNRDKGPSTNSGARTLVIISSGIVGLGAGLFVANRCTADQGDMTTNMFIGGALGLGAGVAIGALVMPRDYNVAQQSRIDFLKQRQAWLQDPIKLKVAQSFRPAQTVFTLSF